MYVSVNPWNRDKTKKIQLIQLVFFHNRYEKVEYYTYYTAVFNIQGQVLVGDLNLQNTSNEYEDKINTT